MIELIHGDSLEILPNLNKSFDVVLCDPPYSASFVGKLYNRLKQYQEKATLKKGRIYNPWKWGGIPGRWSDNFYKTNDEYEEFTKAWMASVFKLLRHGGFLASFGTHKLIHVNVSLAESVGFSLRDIIIWQHKSGFSKGYKLSRITGQKEHQSCNTMTAKAYEPILLFQKPTDGSIINNYKLHQTGFIDMTYLNKNIIQINKPSKEEKQSNPHYSIKPRKLIEILLKGLMAKTVLDPFMGSGTIPYVCKQLNLDCTAIELEEEFFNYANSIIGND